EALGIAARELHGRARAALLYSDGGLSLPRISGWARDVGDDGGRQGRPRGSAREDEATGATAHVGCREQRSNENQGNEACCSLHLYAPSMKVPGNGSMS